MFFVERWLSGLKLQIANLVYVFNVPWVQIPSSPNFLKPLLYRVIIHKLKNIKNSMFASVSIKVHDVICMVNLTLV